MRKKILSLLLCTSMAAGMLTGCGGSGDSTSKKNDASSADSSAASSDADATPIPTNAVSGDENADDAFVVWG